MKRSYKYRIYPSCRQVRILTRMLETHRRFYNDALEYRIMMWRAYRRAENAISIGYSLKSLRVEDHYLAECNQNALKRTLRRLDKAYNAFFRRVKLGLEKPGFPKFKRRKFFSSVEYTYNNGIRLKDGRLYAQNVGLIRIFQEKDRSVPEDGIIKAAVVKREGKHRWYVIFQVELPDAQPKLMHVLAVGIDMGLEYFCALSTGELVENPRWCREAGERLAVLQKRQSRCKRGSKQYVRLGLQVNVLHRRVQNRRRDFHHKLSTRIVQEFGTIAVEDLNIKGLAKSHVRKSVGDAGWGAFLYMLQYKAEEHGKRFIRVDPRNTSQLCSSCGSIVRKDLSVREHDCPHCGFTVQRDVNAALVILKRGTNLLDRQAV